ncbi:MAG: SUMF1/EgtB/PvdO family nonheme iron enzyme [Pseudanabaenaceae cyanobacterium]
MDTFGKALPALQALRAQTLARVTPLSATTLCAQPHPEFSPIGWHLGHIGHIEARWWLNEAATLAEFAVDATVKSQRGRLPPLETLLSALAAVRERSQHQPIAPRLAWWLLQHEAQHLETMAIVQQLQNPDTPLPLPSVVPQAVAIAATVVTVGSDAVWAQDNERPARAIALPAYRLQAPVTKREFGEFMVAGGYQRAKWWSVAGWAWQQQAQVPQPLYWEALRPEQPVCGVSFYEAEAFCRFAGQRLPTEWEWEAAWQQGAIAPAGIWEWTASPFAPPPDFAPFPYTGYSSAYFDGCHRVLRGYSWATPFPCQRPSFRNWYLPHIRPIFAGFRCVEP